jgi:hypothetical protein
VQLLSWHQVDFPSVLLAGLVGGYVMAIGGLWAGTIPGLVAVDIADFGRRYMVSDRPMAWLLGLGSHLTNSVILVLIWAMVIRPNIHVPQLVSGFVWGEVLAVALAGALMAPLSGLGIMGRKTGSHRFALTNIGLHGLWGLVVGFLYAAP